MGAKSNISQNGTDCFLNRSDHFPKIREKSTVLRKSCSQPNSCQKPN